MKKITKIKALFIALMMLLSLIAPVTSTAQQTDGFFRGGNDNYQNRDVSIDDGGGISNWGIGETVPLGSGLLILTAVGTGYAIMRRKSYKAYKTHETNKSYNCGATLFLSLALIFGITSCKKNVETISSAATEGVFITLDVDGGNNGSRVIVNPTGHTDPNYATVTFENGDIIYVGNNGAYCGYLEYNGSTSQFEGNVNPTSTADYLHFYFMGNKGAKSEPTSMSITDQTEKYPVISYAHSKEFYSSSTLSYTAKLQNYCAIVRFTTTNINVPITIEGMNNTVEVNFGANNAAAATPTLDNNPYTFSKTGDGQITLHAESSTDRWAILLPQGEVTTAMAYADGYVSNGVFTVPEINTNTYHGGTGGTGISVTMTDVRFSVGASTKVLFAPGNLQAVFATANNSSCTWQFAPTQYSIIGNNTANNAIGNNVVTTAGTVDLFGWVGNSSSLAAYGINNSNGQFDYGFQYNEALKSDWGVVANADNLGGHNDWRTLTNAEWGYLFERRTNASQKYGHGSVNGVNGIIILPDVWVLPLGLSFTAGVSEWTNSYTAAQWEKMEDNGAVFLPAAGLRYSTTVNDDGYVGFYWSSTSFEDYIYMANSVSIQSNSLIPQDYLDRYFGCSVRLARYVN